MKLLEIILLQGTFCNVASKINIGKALKSVYKMQKNN